MIDGFSVLGMYTADSSIFDGLKLPTTVDKSILIDNLMFDCAELEVIYQDPCFLKFAVSAWSAKMLPSWTQMAKALTEQYDMLHNFDRTEEWSEDGTNKLDRNTNSTGSGSSSSEGSSTGNTEGTSAHSNTAYNSNAPKVANLDNDSVDSRNDTKSSGSSTAQSSQAEQETGNNTTKHSGRMYGNIGVTTSQQLLESEMELRKKWNIYTIIVSDFQQHFCINVY